MQTKTLIQSSANILRVTELKIGNVIKLIEKEYSSNKELYYGIVTDLLNSGEETYIQLLLFKKQYSEITGQIKIYSGKDDLALFPATKEEVENDLSYALNSLKEKILEDEKELQNKKDAYEKAKNFINGEMSKKLINASFEELTTEQFKEEQKIKQIEAIKKSD